jgi:hypothetical protein
MREMLLCRKCERKANWACQVHRKEPNSSKDSFRTEPARQPATMKACDHRFCAVRSNKTRPGNEWRICNCEHGFQCRSPLICMPKMLSPPCRTRDRGRAWPRAIATGRFQHSRNDEGGFAREPAFNPEPNSQSLKARYTPKRVCSLSRAKLNRVTLRDFSPEVIGKFPPGEATPENL